MKRFEKSRSVALWAVLVTAVLVPFFIYEESVNAWINIRLDESAGDTVAVAFVLFTVLASDIFLPVPSCLLSAMCGVFLGPYLGFAVSFTAMTASSFSGFFIGRFFVSLARRLVGRDSCKVESLDVSGRPFMLFVLRPVPVLAECSCVYAGLKRYPFGASALWLSLGNAVVSAVYAVIGHVGRADDSFVPSFAAVVVLSGLGWLCGKLAARA